MEDNRVEQVAVSKYLTAMRASSFVEKTIFEFLPLLVALTTKNPSRVLELVYEAVETLVNSSLSGEGSEESVTELIKEFTAVTGLTISRQQFLSMLKQSVKEDCQRRVRGYADSLKGNTEETIESFLVALNENAKRRAAGSRLRL